MSAKLNLTLKTGWLKVKTISQYCVLVVKSSESCILLEEPATTNVLEVTVGVAGPPYGPRTVVYTPPDFVMFTLQLTAEPPILTALRVVAVLGQPPANELPQFSV